MKIIERYVLRNFLFPFLYCLTLFIFLYLIFDLFSHIDDIFKRHVPPLLLLNYYISFIPIIFIQVTPVAVLLATLYTMGDMNRHHELTAMKSCGISTWRLISPFIFTGAALSILIFLLSEKVIPSAYLVYRQIKTEHLESQGGAPGAAPNMRKNVSLVSHGNSLCYAREFDPKNFLLFDLTILEQDSQNRLKDKITARKASWAQGKWTGSDVVWQRYEKGKLSGEPEVMAQADLPVKEGPHEFLESELQSEFMSFSHLKNQLNKFSATANNAIVRNIVVGLHTKLSFPLTSIIAVLLAAPFAMVTRRGSVWRGLGVSLVIGFSYYVVSSLALACGREGILQPAFSAWLPPLLFGGTGIVLLSFSR